MEVKLVVGDKSVALGFAAVENLICELNGDNFLEVIEELSQHPSSAVRTAIARRDDLPKFLVHAFAKDSSIAVSLAVLASDAGRKHLTTKEILDIFARSEEAARDTCWLVENYQEADIDILTERLAHHPDPGVRKALAGNSSIPRKILKILSKDKDTSVASEALNSMK